MPGRAASGVPLTAEFPTDRLEKPVQLADRTCLHPRATFTTH